MQTSICVVKDLTGKYIPLTCTTSNDLANVFMYINRNQWDIECILEVGDYIKLHVGKDKKDKVEDTDYI